MPSDDEARAGDRDQEPIISPDGQWIWSTEQSAWIPNHDVADDRQQQPVDSETSSATPQSDAAPSPRARPATSARLDEVPTGERPAEDAAPVNSPARRRRLALVVAGLLVVGAAVAVVLANRSGDDGSSGPAGSETQAAQSAISQPNQVCLYETLAGIDVIRSADSSSIGPGLYQIQQAIGSQSPLYLLIGQQAASYLASIDQNGVNAAEAKVDSTIRSVCNENNNPVLDRAQLSALSDIATGTDADTLGRVSYYG